MKNNKTVLFLITLLILGLTGGVAAGSNGSARIHPTFKQLLISDPRNEAIINPEIPRISANQALQLLKNNKAVLFSVGAGSQSHNFFGTYVIPENKSWAPETIRKVKSIKNKYIIVFCN